MGSPAPCLLYRQGAGVCCVPVSPALATLTLARLTDPLEHDDLDADDGEPTARAASCTRCSTIWNPSRWRDEKEAAIRARLQSIQRDLEAWLESYGASADQTSQTLRARITTIYEAIRETRPGLDSTRRLDELRESYQAVHERVAPAYEELVASLKANDVRVPSLRPTNYTRNLFHVSAALVAILIVELVPLCQPVGVLAGGDRRLRVRAGGLVDGDRAGLQRAYQ